MYLRILATIQCKFEMGGAGSARVFLLLLAGDAAAAAAVLSKCHARLNSLVEIDLWSDDYVRLEHP